MDNTIKKTKNIGKINFVNMVDEEAFREKVKSAKKVEKRKHLIYVSIVSISVFAFFFSIFGCIIFCSLLSVSCFIFLLRELNCEKYFEHISAAIIPHTLNDLYNLRKCIDDENILIIKAFLELKYVLDVFDGKEHLISKCIVYATTEWEVKISLEGFSIEEDSTLGEGEIKIDYEGKLLYISGNNDKNIQEKTEKRSNLGCFHCWHSYQEL